MGLLQNYARINAEPLHYISSGVAATAAAHRDRSRWNIPAQNINRFTTEADNYDSNGNSQLQKAGYPYGYGPPYQFVMPVKGGAMLANVSINGEGEVTISFAETTTYLNSISVLSGRYAFPVLPVSCGTSGFASLGGFSGSLILFSFLARSIHLSKSACGTSPFATRYAI